MLGDTTEELLTKIGVTKEVVEKWLGTPCNCTERKEKLNQLDRWTRQVLKKGLTRAKEYLQGIIE